MQESRESAASTPWLDFSVVIALCWGWPMVGSIMSLAGWYPIDAANDWAMLRLVIYEIVTGSLAFLFLRARGWRGRNFLFRIGWRNTGAGVLLFVAMILLLEIGYALGRALGVSTALLDDLANGTTSIQTALIVANVNGVFEELLLVGFVFAAIERLGLSFAGMVSALLRMLGHIYQGPVGALSILCLGLLLALLYARYRQLWPLILAHILTDFFALA